MPVKIRAYLISQRSDSRHELGVDFGRLIWGWRFGPTQMDLLVPLCAVYSTAQRSTASQQAFCDQRRGRACVCVDGQTSVRPRIRPPNRIRAIATEQATPATVHHFLACTTHHYSHACRVRSDCPGHNVAVGPSGNRLWGFRLGFRVTGGGGMGAA